MTGGNEQEGKVLGNRADRLWPIERDVNQTKGEVPNKSQVTDVRRLVRRRVTAVTEARTFVSRLDGRVLIGPCHRGNEDDRADQENGEKLTTRQKPARHLPAL